MIHAGSYTNALAATGYGFAYWKVLDRGCPALANLQPYRVVITADNGRHHQLHRDQQTLTLSPTDNDPNLLNNGGSFFIASMGILSQIGDVPFRANVLQVGGFLPEPGPARAV